MSKNRAANRRVMMPNLANVGVQRIPFSDLVKKLARPLHKEVTYIVTFTPADATRILTDFNPNNRTISMKHVNIQKNLMSSGQFHCTAAFTIVFNKNGSLADGQHRFSAQVDLGKTLDYHVVLGCDVTSSDTGITRPRSVADKLETTIRMPRSEAVNRAALATALVKKHTNQEVKNQNVVLELVNKYSEEFDFYSALKQRATNKARNANVYAAFIQAERIWPQFREKLREGAERFAIGTMAGSTATKGDAMIVLREHLLTKGAKLKGVEIYATTLNALDSLIHDRVRTKVSTTVPTWADTPS